MESIHLKNKLITNPFWKFGNIHGRQQGVPGGRLCMKLLNWEILNVLKYKILKQNHYFQKVKFAKITCHIYILRHSRKYVSQCVCVFFFPMPTHCTITRFGFRAGRIDGIECGLFFSSRTAWADHITYGTSIYVVYWRKLRLGWL